jgi:hypothetical protein
MCVNQGRDAEELNMERVRKEKGMRDLTRALEQKLKNLEEVAEGSSNRDCQAITAAKIEYLAQLLKGAETVGRKIDFRIMVEDELEEAQAAQRLSRNPFMVAGFQVKISLLESVQRIINTHQALPTAKILTRAVLVPA